MPRRFLDRSDDAALFARIEEKDVGSPKTVSPNGLSNPIPSPHPP